MSFEPKLRNVLEKIRVKARQGDFIVLPHAVERRIQRDISVPDIVRVLTTGIHEESKDQYKSEFHAWNYAIRGRSLDNRDLRIAVSFDEDNMLIITVIRLGRNR